MSAEIIRSAPCTIPTLEALPHYPLPLGYFVGVVRAERQNPFEDRAGD